MDMKKILQALDTASTKPVEGASSMAKFLRVVKEADINQAAATPAAAPAPAATPAPAIQVPEIPPMPAQDGDQGDGSKLTTNPDGTKTYAGAFGTFTYNAQGQAIKYASPNFGGFGQEIDLTNKQTKQSYSQGPLSIQQTRDASGAVTNTDSEYDLGVAKLKQNAGINGTTNSATVPAGATQQVISEGANPHKVALPVQMAMQHYQDASKKVVAKESIIGKYFSLVEEEQRQQQVEKKAFLKQYATIIAERVRMKETSLKDKEDLTAKRKALHDLSLNKDVDQKHVQQRKLDLEKEAKDKDLDEDNDPCWDSYKQIGTKKKGGKTVPNCVPKK